MTESWLDAAACKGLNTDWWFDEQPGGVVSHVTRVAMSICAECPVQEPCLETALEHGYPGIWAGTTGRERQRMGKDFRRCRFCGRAILEQFRKFYCSSRCVNRARESRRRERTQSRRESA